MSADVYEVTMPKLGETVTEGVVSQWLKQVGDTVAFDDPLFEVSTDKVDSEVPSPYDGVLLEILVSEGDTVPVGTPLARIGEPGARIRAVIRAAGRRGRAGVGNGRARDRACRGHHPAGRQRPVRRAAVPGRAADGGREGHRPDRDTPVLERVAGSAART